MKISQYKKVYVGKRCFYIGSEHQKIKDKNVHELIKKRYQKKNKNRDYIVDSLINQISFKGKLPKKHSITIIKVDIKNFFESINTHKLYKRLVRSNILNDEAMQKIKQVVFSPKIKGLPQGVSFSSLLAEVYLEDFDYNVKIELDELLFYSRYVDDILIILNGDYSNKIKKVLSIIEDLLVPLGLKLNEKDINLESNSEQKYEVCIIGNKSVFSFNYLGYNFSNLMDNNKLTISVSNSKIIKYSNYIESLFNRFYSSNKSDQDFYKLYYSLRNLLWVTISKDFKKNTNLIYGFKYNYKRINTFEPKEILNKKIKHHIHCKKCLNRKQKALLYGLLFNPVKENLQTFNYNKLSSTKILEIMQNLSITPIIVQNSYSKRVWIGQIFKELYK